jgi:hypothetical protein
MKSKFVSFVIGLLVSLSAFAVGEAGITTGSATGKYYAMGRDIQKQCAATVPLIVYESAGSVSNVERVLSDPRYQYGIVQQDALAYKALSDPKARDKIKLIMPLHNDEIHLIATQASGIRSINDLRGKRVIVGAEGSGNYVTSAIIKAKTDIEWADVEIAPDQGLSQLLLGQADAMFYVVGKPAGPLMNLSATAGTKIKLIPLKHPNLEGFYISTLLPDHLYPWNPAAVSTYSVKNVLVTFDFKSQYQQEIGALTQCIVNNVSKWQGGAGDAKWREVDPADYKLVKWGTHPVSQRIIDRAVYK